MIRTLTASLVVLLAVLLAACDGNANSPSFTLTRENIIESQSRMRGTVYKQVGADGPYREDSTLIDTYGDAGSVRAGSGTGQISESWPATPNYFYEGTAYSNAKGEGFIVIRKVSKEEAEQASSSNGG